MKRVLFALALVVVTVGVAYASGGGEGGEAHGGQLANFGWRMLNFVILAAVLYKLTAKGIKGFFVGRRAEIKTSLEAADVARAEAQKKLDECNVKLEKASSEISGIAEMIKSQGAEEKAKILAEAEAAAVKMQEDAKARIDQEYKRAVIELRAEATELSVQMAEEIIKKNIGKDDHEMMVNDFLDRMVSRN